MSNQEANLRLRKPPVWKQQHKQFLARILRVSDIDRQFQKKCIVIFKVDVLEPSTWPSAEPKTPEAEHLPCLQRLKLVAAKYAIQNRQNRQRDF